MSSTVLWFYSKLCLKNIYVVLALSLSWKSLLTSLTAGLFQQSHLRRPFLPEHPALFRRLSFRPHRPDALHDLTPIHRHVPSQACSSSGIPTTLASHVLPSRPPQSQPGLHHGDLLPDDTHPSDTRRRCSQLRPLRHKAHTPCCDVPSTCMPGRRYPDLLRYPAETRQRRDHWQDGDIPGRCIRTLRCGGFELVHCVDRLLPQEAADGQHAAIAEPSAPECVDTAICRTVDRHQA